MTTSPLDMTGVLEVDGRHIDLVWVATPRVIEAGHAWLDAGLVDETTWGYLATGFWPVEQN